MNPFELSIIQLKLNVDELYCITIALSLSAHWVIDRSVSQYLPESASKHLMDVGVASQSNLVK